MLLMDLTAYRDLWKTRGVMALLASAQLAVVVIVLLWYPETAHRELEDLNPEDAAPTVVT